MDKSQIDYFFIASITLERWRFIAKEIDEIKHHHILVENALKSEADRVDDEIWKVVEQIEDEDLRQDVFEGAGSLRFRAEHMYPNMHRSTMLMTLYSYLECTLFFYCSYLEKYFLEETSSIPRGSVLKYRKWLERNAGLNFEKLDIEWAIIDELRILRNSIVHSFGSVEEGSTVEDIINSNEYIDFCEAEVGMGNCHGSDSGFTIDDGYFDYIIQTIKEFFRKLSECLEPVIGVDEETAKKRYEELFDEQAEDKGFD